MDDDKKVTKPSGIASEPQAVRGAQQGPGRAPEARTSEMEDLYRRLEPELRRTKPNPEAIAAALEAAQRLSAEADADQRAGDIAESMTGFAGTEICPVCGHGNRVGNKFCAMCGIPMRVSSEAALGAGEARQPPQSFALSPNPFLDQTPGTRPTAPPSPALETHHYHHHYHHHYFPAGYEGGAPRAAASNPVREEKIRPSPAFRGEMSRTEAAVRRVTHEWMLACNTKHLDDLLDLYVADALVLRSNYPPVRGAAAVREFFFGALEAGLGEVEIEPLKIEVAGDLAYEAGRCKALVPGAAGKRREERGKYLWVCARQSNGEWKLTADCWSSDLSLSVLESDVPSGAGVKTGTPRKGT